MENIPESVNTLYPLRPSEVVRQPGFLTGVKPLDLREEEREEITSFEEPLFRELQGLKDISVSTHIIYPGAFESKQGSRLFSIIYLDQSLKDRLEALATGRGVELKEKKIERQFYDAFFNDCLNIAGSEDDFQRYGEVGVEFKGLTQALNSLTGKEEETVVLKGELPEQKQLRRDEIESRFLAVDLVNVPDQLRTRANLYTSDWAKEQFAQAFLEAGGEVEAILNPERISRIVDLDKLMGKISGLRIFKNKLKKINQGLEGLEDDLVEAERIVVTLYRRYVNVLIAEEYPAGRVLATQPVRTEKEKLVLDQLKGITRPQAGDRFAPDKASRTLERIDHFLKGTGLRVDDNGLLESIPERLAAYVEHRAEGFFGETESYKRYNSIDIEPEQVRTIGERIMTAYGFNEGETGWQVVVLKGQKGMKVSDTDKEVIIPEQPSKRGLVEKLVSLAHEIEGHVLRRDNQDKVLGKGLKLVRELSLGREEILSEAAAMRIGDRTQQIITGSEREAKPYYYLILLEKSRGGSFKECFRVLFAAHARRNYGLSLAAALENQNKFREIFNYVYPLVFRIFRKNTPLDDHSGFLPDSDQLKYIEQELVVDVLEEVGLGKLICVSGVDLYSLQELAKLGMLDLRKAQEPKLITALKIWPQIKQGIDEGRSLEEITATL